MAHHDAHGGAELKRWLKSHDLTHQWLADEMDRTTQWVSKVCSGDIEPSLHKAVEIERLTKGKVKASSLILPARKLAMAS
jgi:predicted transcriptional regulator